MDDNQVRSLFCRAAAPRPTEWRASLSVELEHPEYSNAQRYRETFFQISILVLAICALLYALPLLVLFYNSMHTYINTYMQALLLIYFNILSMVGFFLIGE